MSEERDRKLAALELAASMLQTGAAISPAFGLPGLTPALQAIASILRAAEQAMRDHGKSVEEIVAAIKMPGKLDVADFRNAVDERIREKPEKG